MKENVTFIPNPEQLKFAELWLDCSKKRTYEEIATDIGITYMTIWRWHQDKDFVDWINEQGSSMLRSALSRVYKSLIRKAESGDVSAIKLYLENLGEFVSKTEITIGWKE